MGSPIETTGNAPVPGAGAAALYPFRDRGLPMRHQDPSGDGAGANKSPMTDRIVRLIAAARGFEDDGHYSEARALRAAALSEEIRLTGRRMRLGQGLEQEVRDLVDDFRAAQGAQELVTVLEAIAESAPVRPAAATHRLYVCRWCGHAEPAVAPNPCPGCGAGGLVFTEVPGVFFLELVPVPQLLEALAATPEQCRRYCAGLDEDRAALGEWPVATIVSHLIGANELLGGSAIEALERDDPPARALIAPEAVSAGQGTTLQQRLDTFAEARRALLERVGGLTPAQWERSRVHPLWERMTVQRYLSYIARHEHLHLAHLRASADRARGGGMGHGLGRDSRRRRGRHSELLGPTP